MAINEHGLANIKERINRGDTVRAVTLPVTTGKDGIAAAVEAGGYDFVNTDAQHAACDEERLQAFCAAATDIGVPVKLRIKHTDHAYLIGNYLDLGPSGIEIPEVMEESTVDEALRRFYYPPVGRRSWGGSTRAGWSPDATLREYADWWNGFGWLCLQIESVEAVINARKLAKSGVDMVSFGPADLTFSLEMHPEFPLRTVDECIAHVADQLSGSGVRLTHRIDNPANRSRYTDMGITVFLERLG